MKPVYEPNRDNLGYRAECNLCDWWESALSFAAVRTEARAHMVTENAEGRHESAVVTIWKLQGEMVNLFEKGDPA